MTLPPRWLEELGHSVAGREPQRAEALLVDYPVAIGLQRQEWRHDLLREFQLITHGVHDSPDHLTLPKRLLALADDMTMRYGRLVEQHTAELERALEEGADRIVLHYPLLPAAVDAELELARAMEECDAYCRDQALMTLGPTPSMYALRRWVVEELVYQYDGAQPRPWPEFLATG